MGVGLQLGLAAALILLPQDPAEEKTATPVLENPAVVQDVPDSQVNTEEPWLPVHGMAVGRYVLRDATRDRRDQDLYAYLNLQVGNARLDPVTASFHGRAVWDLEGGGIAGIGRSLSSIRDVRNSSLDLKMYRGTLTFHRLLPDTQVTVGRQAMYDTPIWLTLDGVTVEGLASIASQDFDISLYGGVPTHFWEASTEGDLVGGLAVETRPWVGGTVRVDAMRIEDENLFGNPENDLIGVRVDHSLPGGTWGSLGWTRLDDRTRDVTGSFGWTDEDLDLRVQGFGKILLSRQANLAYEFDPFTAILAPEEPFQEGQIMVSKGFDGGSLARAVRVDAGAYARGVRSSSRVSEFNREFERYWVGGTLEGFPWNETDLTLVGEAWDSGVDSIQTAGGEINARLNDALRLTVGSSYALYKFDFFEGVERFGVQDYYARLRYILGGGVTVTARLELEDDEDDRFYILYLQVEYHF